jgi:hypothetical protein
MLCPGLWGLDGKQVDRFRGMIVDGGGGHSCRRCWMSQKFCTTGQDVAKPCQWRKFSRVEVKDVLDDRLLFDARELSDVRWSFCA